MESIKIICTIVGSSITIIGTVLGGMRYIVRKAQQTAVDRYRMDKMKEAVKKMRVDMGRLNNNVSNLKNDVSLLKTDMSELKTDISAIRTVLVQKFPNVALVMSMKKSPRKLNEIGEWVFNQVQGEKFQHDNREFFFSKIDAMKPQTALDVENAANFACAGYTEEPIFNDIKMFVYNAPSITIKDSAGTKKPYDLTLGDICYALSLPLRDMYLKEHPEVIQ